MVPAKQDIKIMRGDTETFVISIKDSTNSPVDLSTSVFASQIRYNRDDIAIAASFTCTVTNAAAGQVTIVLSATSSAALEDGIAYWDLQRTVGGEVSTVVAGKCTILADVTR